MVIDTTVQHPAKYSAKILAVIARHLDTTFGRKRPVRIWDPFAGVGGIHVVVPEDCEQQWWTVGTELEPEWAVQAPGASVVADALRPPFRPATFDAVVTSPAYGNRMADHHEAKDPCSACGGSGEIEVEAQYFGSDGPPSIYAEPCKKCGGTGLSVRNTYRHKLGRPLTPNNSGGMQWGIEYRAFHEDAWWVVWESLKPGGYFMLNVSDHIRKGEVVKVSQWHHDICLQLGFVHYLTEAIATPRNRMGSNANVRVEHENLFIFRKKF